MILLYGVAGVLLLLVVTGRIHWMFAAVSAALPWLQRVLMARRVWQMFKSTRSPASGQVSKVETAFLRMTLDHDSGDLAGEVIAGAFAGQQLEQMSLEKLESGYRHRGHGGGATQRLHEPAASCGNSRCGRRRIE